MRKCAQIFLILPLGPHKAIRARFFADSGTGPVRSGPLEVEGRELVRSPVKKRAQAAGARFWGPGALFARPKRAPGRVRARQARDTDS